MGKSPERAWAVESEASQWARLEAKEEAERTAIVLAQRALQREVEAPLAEVRAGIFRTFMLLAHRLSVEMAEYLAIAGGTSLLGMLVLEWIDRQGGSRGPRDVAAALGSARASATELLGRLERDGLVVLVDDPRDRRRKVVRLTAEGSAQAARARTFFGSWNEELTSSFDEDDVRRLYTLLLALDELVVYRHPRRHARRPHRGPTVRRAALHVR
ncbi:MAG: MarR family transcriptional regulator [Labilithrix sp.]|nr:MarR family transcriptional regulator [Labilithrix sp.]